MIAGNEAGSGATLFVELAGGRRVGVVSGLDAGTRVVTAGTHSLTPGQHVRIEQDATP